VKTNLRGGEEEGEERRKGEKNERKKEEEEIQKEEQKKGDTESNHRGHYMHPTQPAFNFRHTLTWARAARTDARRTSFSARIASISTNTTQQSMKIALRNFNSTNGR
jgi:hypothetical protein